MWVPGEREVLSAGPISSQGARLPRSQDPPDQHTGPGRYEREALNIPSAEKGRLEQIQVPCTLIITVPPSWLLLSEGELRPGCELERMS